MGQPVIHKVVLFFGHVTFCALLVLAFKHAEIRTTSGDSAYQVFKWVNDAGLSIEAHRYSAILPELAVKCFKYFHADLKTLLMVASVTHVLVAYLVFLICLLGLKAPRSAMAAALAAVLCTRLTFYGPVLEANYLLCYPFLFFAMLEQNGSASISRRKLAGLVVAGAFTLLAHPLGWLLLLNGILFLWAIRHISAKSAVLVSSGVVIGAGAVRLLFPPTAYEQAQYGNLLEAFSDNGLAGPWGSWEFLIGHTFHFTTNYLPALMLVIAVVIGYMVRKHWIAAAVIGGGVIGFLVLELVTFRAGDAAIMMDRAFLPGATLIALPFIWLLWGLRGRWAIMGSSLLVLVLFIKLRDISFASREPQRQLERIEHLLTDLHQHSIKKAEVSEVELQSRSIQANWALPFGTLLISSMDGPEHSKTVRMINTQAMATVRLDAFPVTPDLNGFISSLNTSYFQLPKGPYEGFPSTQPAP